MMKARIKDGLDCARRHWICQTPQRCNCDELHIGGGGQRVALRGAGASSGSRPCHVQAHVAILMHFNLATHSAVNLSATSVVSALVKHLFATR